MGSSVFMQDVADAAKVHRTTVSLALRDHPRIPRETRERIKSLAAKLGYRTDPFIAALMHAKRTRRPTPQHASLAYVTSYPTRYGWRTTPNVPDFFPSAVTHAATLGFKLEDFWLTEPGMTPQRFSNILTARNIQGLILAPPPPGVRSLTMEWERFSVVTIGVGLEEPAVHRVSDNHFHTAQLVLKKCLEKGFRRVGFHVQDLRSSAYRGVTEKFVGAYQAALQLYSEIEPLPILHYHQPERNPFLRWLTKHRPQIVVTGRSTSAALREWLTEDGYKVPGDVSLASFGLSSPRGWLGGIYHDPAVNAAAAVDLLVAQVHRHQRGLPPQANDLLVRGRWIDGESVRLRP